jgi:hypothetical protein
MRSLELTYRSKRIKEGVKLDLVMCRCLSQGGKCSGNSEASGAITQSRGLTLRFTLNRLVPRPGMMSKPSPNSTSVNFILAEL